MAVITLKKRSTILCGFVIGFLFFLAQGRVFGWGNTWMGTNLEQIVNATRWKTGSFRYNAAFRLDNAGYDSDIYYGASPSPVSDYTFAVGSAIRLFLPLKKKLVFDVSEFPQYVFYLRANNERALNNTFRGQVHLVLDRFYIQAGEGLVATRDRLSTELNIRIRHKENNLTGLVLWQISKETSIALQYRRWAYEYEDLTYGGSNIRENLNRVENYFNFRAYLQQISRTRFYLDGEYGSYVFTENVSSFKDSRSYGVYAGVEFLPAPGGRYQARGVQGRLNLGYKRFDILDRGMKDFAGLVGNTNISIGFLRVSALRGFFARDVQFSAFSDSTYYLQTIYGAGLSRFLTRRILLAYDFFFSRNIYPSMDSEVPPSDRTFQYRTHSFSLLLRLRRNLELNLIASLGKRDANLTVPGGRRNFFGFNLIYGYSSGDNPVLGNPVSQLY